MKSSLVVKSVLVGTPVFLAGCGCYVQPQPVVTTSTPVVAADGVPVITYAQPGYHFSPFYHGYVPIFIPIGGMGYGNTYQTFYNRVPVAERTRYATPTSSGRASAAPIRMSTPVSSKTATPSSSSAARPTSSSPTPSTSAAKPASSTSSTTRGIAGSTGLGHGSSAS